MFDTLKFLETEFSDADGLIGLLAKHRQETPKREAVRKWFSRGSVPAEWMPILIIVLEDENGTPPALRSYFSEATQHDIFC